MKFVELSRVWMLPAALMLGFLGCSSSDDDGSDGKPQVYTTFYPTTYFCGRIAGDQVDIVCPIPADEDPIFWQPSAETLEDYQGADLIVINGAGFERWVAKASLPSAKLVDTANPLHHEFLKFDLTISHSHSTDDSHSHEGVDGHTWLDPRHAKVQADQIRKALAKLLPDQAEKFQANYAALAADLDAIDRLLEDLSDKMGGQHILASHPAYNYPAKRYDWNLTSLDLDPAAMPDAATLDEMREILKSKPARFILWESPPDEQIAARLLGELELTSVTFSPCELLDEESVAAGKDYVSIMKENIVRLSEALSQEP